MFSLQMLLSVLALTLLAVTVESSSGGDTDFHYDLSGQKLTDLYNSPVYKAEWMIRPFGSSSSVAGPLSHTGVRVTLANEEQWLIHKGSNYGIDSQTVVTSARRISPAWRTMMTKQFNGRKRVADFVKTGGATYNLLFNCHVASGLMMLHAGNNFSYDLSGKSLTDLYNSPVYKAERMRRPLGSSSTIRGPISHTGVRVTLADGSQWLVHKGGNYGIDSQTVVVDAQHMSPDWRVEETKDFNGEKTISDFVAAGGENYNLLFSNCHNASRDMMDQ